MYLSKNAKRPHKIVCNEFNKLKDINLYIFIYTLLQAILEGQIFREEILRWMNEQDFLIYLLKVAVPLVTVAYTVFKGITEPVNKLKEEIIKLEVSLNSVKEHNVTQDNRINKHSEEIDDLKLTTTNHESRISSLENRECRYEMSKNK